MDPAQDASEQNTFATILRAYRFPIIIGVASLACITIAVVLLVKSTQISDPIVFSDGVVAGDITIGLIKVDVEGAVEKPGVYSLPLDSRIEDAIASAGGFTQLADPEYIAKKLNRAARVVDGGKIFIPESDGNTKTHNKSYATSESLDSASYNLSPVIATSQTPSQNGANSVPSDHLISINDASVNELDSLPGIGPVTAGKIIDNRPYQILEELLTKKAVGKSVYEKIKEMISL